MIKIIYFVADAFKLLTSHKLIAFLLVLQSTIYFCLTGIISTRLDTTNEQIQSYESNIFSKEYYRLTENFDDGFFYLFMENDYKFKELSDYLNDITKEFNYLIVTEQPIAIKSLEVPEECLNGYESGNHENSITADADNVIVYSTKSLQVSNNFFSEFGIKAQKGDLWSEQDFSYKNGQTIPVVLGSSYSDFNIGQKFDGVYLDRHVTFEVVAVLENYASWSTGESVNYTDRYIFIPSFDVDNVSSFSKMRLLQQLCGTIIDDRDYNAISQSIKEIAQTNTVPYGTTGVSLINYNQETDVLETYSKMTQGIKEQFILLFATLVIFVVFSLSLTINGFIRTHQYEFAVRLLNGATLFDISLNIALILMLIIGASLLISSFVLLVSDNFSKNIFIVSALVTILSAIYPICHIKALDISTVINGKE